MKKRSKKDLEHVLVFCYEDLEEYPYGYDVDVVKYQELLYLPDAFFFFIPRWKAEISDCFKQVIPYIVCYNESGNVLSYCRTPKGGDSRLHNNYSIGIGGHVNPSNFSEFGQSVYGQYLESIKRELYEELGLIKDDIDALMTSGVIYDDRDAVGRVHFGIVHSLLVEDQPLNIENCLTDVQWLTKREISNNRDRYEGWSRLIIESW